MTKASLTLTTITGPGKIPTASPAPSSMWPFAGLSCGRYCNELSTARDHYRPPRQIPPADRPPGNEPFCGAFSSPLLIAVGAGGILASFPDGLSSLSVYPSCGATVMQQVNPQELDRAAYTLAK